jgi:hypothetical protein
MELSEQNAVEGDLDFMFLNLVASTDFGLDVKLEPVNMG